MITNSSWLMPPPSHPAVSTSALDNKISPSIIFALAILAIVFFVCGLLHLLPRHLLRWRRAHEDLSRGGATPWGPTRTSWTSAPRSASRSSRPRRSTVPAMRMRWSTPSAASSAKQARKASSVAWRGVLR
jgi:hypothetical protein